MASTKVLGQHCARPEDIPKGEHWAIIEFTTVSSSDPYDRNGGYISEPCQRYVAYKDRASWEAAVADRTIERYQTPFVAIHANRAEIKTTVAVTVDLK